MVADVLQLKIAGLGTALKLRCRRGWIMAVVEAVVEQKQQRDGYAEQTDCCQHHCDAAVFSTKHLIAPNAQKYPPDHANDVKRDHLAALSLKSWAKGVA